MSSFRTLLLGLLCWATLTIPRVALAQQVRDTQAEPEPYFYKGYNYGSQALYGPLWVFLNRGFDVLQDRNDSRGIFQQEYLHNGENVGRNLLNPFPGISQRGWGRFFREEIFPLSFTQGTARWVPNYTLHLIGGGVTYTGLSEWFRQNHSPGGGGGGGAARVLRCNRARDGFRERNLGEQGGSSVQHRRDRRLLLFSTSAASSCSASIGPTSYSANT